MPRPRKWRSIGRMPSQSVFKPAGIALDDLSQVSLLPDELESLRLADLQGLSQEEAANQMQISRSTFKRILEHAHRQVALALVEGLALHIEQANQAEAPGSKRKSKRTSSDSE